jgi:hypothetical protein
MSEARPVTAVGLWELHRLRVHHGIAVRDMLMRQPVQPGRAPCVR